MICNYMYSTTNNKTSFAYIGTITLPTTLRFRVQGISKVEGWTFLLMVQVLGKSLHHSILIKTIQAFIWGMLPNVPAHFENQSGWCTKFELKGWIRDSKFVWWHKQTSSKNDLWGSLSLVSNFQQYDDIMKMMVYSVGIEVIITGPNDLWQYLEQFDDAAKLVWNSFYIFW